MLSVQVKICGTTNLADARYCAAMGADYLGFVLHEPSPRYVEPEQAKEIIEWIEGPRSVGVFVNREADEVNRIADEAGFDLVQLHGDESPDFCALIEKPVIRAIRIRDTDTTDSLAQTLAAFESVVTSFLLDTHVPGQFGGTGETFSWEVAKSISRDYPVFLAGGLNPENVSEAINMVKPVAVDVASGVEDAPGRKSFEAIDRFFAALATKQTDSDHAA
jgi:phosphoribosylanthranilate isomerase